MSKPLAWGSAGVDEDSFVRSFEACQYPNDQFKHLDHVRLAWIYIRRWGARAAEERIARSIYRFALSLGHGEKYHATITTAWMRLVHSAYCSTPAIEDFDRFISSHAWLADKRNIHLFYSQSLLSSPQARQQWIEPDIRPLMAPSASCDC
jgi:hypothetical protein